METIELTRYFVKIVQQGSFSKAASLLKVPKSTLSKALSKLEKDTGTKLLIRTTRNQTLTAAGRAFYETCLGPVQLLEDAQRSLYGQDTIISGKIRITAPEDVGHFAISPLIGKLMQKNPQLSFELKYTNEVVDLVKEGFDLAIRFGTLKMSRLKAKKIADVHRILLASPDYIEKFGRPKSPEDLQKHSCLDLSSSTANNVWVLGNSKDEKKKIAVQIKAESNQMSSLKTLAMVGSGIAFIPSYICSDEIKSKDLVHILPDWAGESIALSIVSPVSLSSAARIKIVSEEMSRELQKVLTPIRSPR